MTPLAQAVIVLCIVVLTAVLVWTLLALKKTALRAEGVLHLVEREIQPMASQVEGLTGELRTLSHHANREVERIGLVVTRLEDASAKAARVATVVANLTRVGQYAGIAAGAKRGLNVFVRRLKQPRP
ncbi:MAG TPA: DUF948 domain-containing protein [Candidatus Methylomirabilis sp.]|nr:DUF948 domain-containing protein [Candidatus Methylomirabilis sp.]